ncbi:uncharacterized protein LOC119400708 [Rhipicephalus sanguineus]|uniref:uncharacterized protein LOC119400708 n=1 Tax=Rhipicephalus sanguineus TaxID=34632 RepID=UPI0020C475EA|nr:uncharacterized protein LOC119400708 [Rhipicephalus sanguineus]
MSKKYKSHKMCCVPQCTRRAVKGEVSLHTFPSDNRVKKEWVVKLRIGKPVTETMRVCSAHFVPEDFFWGTTAPEIWKPARRQLKKTAVPSQCLPVRSLDNEDPARNQASAERASRAVARASRLHAADPLDGLQNIPCSPPQNDPEGASLTSEASEPESTGNMVKENTKEDDAAEALVLLGAHPTEFEGVNSAAVESLLQFNRTQTASLHKAVQVNPCTAPSTCRTLVDLFQSDACVKAFTGVEDMRLLMTIADAVAEVDNLKAERIPKCHFMELQFLKLLHVAASKNVLQ